MRINKFKKYLSKKAQKTNHKKQSLKKKHNKQITKNQLSK